MDGTDVYVLSPDLKIDGFVLADDILKNHAKILYMKLNKEGQFNFTALEQAKYSAAQKLSKLTHNGTKPTLHEYNKLRVEFEKPVADEFRSIILSAHSNRYRNGDTNPISFDGRQSAMTKTIRMIDQLDQTKLRQLRNNKEAYAEFCLQAHIIANDHPWAGKKKVIGDYLEKALALESPNHSSSIGLTTFLTVKGSGKINQEPVKSTVANLRPVEKDIPKVTTKEKIKKFSAVALATIFAFVATPNAVFNTGVEPETIDAQVNIDTPEIPTIEINQSNLGNGAFANATGSLFNPVSQSPIKPESEENADSLINLYSDTAPSYSTNVPSMPAPVLEMSNNVITENFNDTVYGYSAPSTVDVPSIDTVPTAEMNTTYAPTKMTNNFTFEQIPLVVKAYYEQQGIEIPNALQRQLNKFEFGLENQNNPTYKGHVEMAAFDAVKIAVGQFGNDFLSQHGYTALDLIGDRQGGLRAKDLTNNAEGYYQMKYPAFTHSS